MGNLTRGNASWTDKYFAFGGAKMDVLQLFVSRAAYHEVRSLLSFDNLMHLAPYIGTKLDNVGIADNHFLAFL